VRAASDRRLTLTEASEFDSPIGKGVIGIVEGHKVALGAERYLAELDIDTSALSAVAESMRKEGATAIYCAVDGALRGVFAIADPIKATTPAALAALRRGGIKLVMLTGDNKTTAEAVGRRLGLDQV